MGWTWTIGITAAPRSEDTLPASVASLFSAGFEQRPTVFSEPETQITDMVRQRCDVVQREEKLGVNGNWYNALQTLLAGEPTAFILMCQDDIVVCKGLPRFLDKTIEPHPKRVFTLYTAHRTFNWRGKGGWLTFRWWAPDRGFPGALALAIPWQVAVPLAQHGRNQNPGPEARHIDHEIGLWMQKRGIELRYHRPSLVDHTGQMCSTLYDSDRRRCTRRFATSIDENGSIVSRRSGVHR